MRRDRFPEALEMKEETEHGRVRLILCKQNLSESQITDNKLEHRAPNIHFVLQQRRDGIDLTHLWDARFQLVAIHRKKLSP